METASGTQNVMVSIAEQEGPVASACFNRNGLPVQEGDGSMGLWQYDTTLSREAKCSDSVCALKRKGCKEKARGAGQ